MIRRKRAAELNMTVSEYIRRLVVTDVAIAESNKYMINQDKRMFEHLR